MNIYEYGVWYVFSFFGRGPDGEYISEFIYTKDKTLGTNKEVEIVMRSKGYIHCYICQMTNGMASPSFTTWWNSDLSHNNSLIKRRVSITQYALDLYSLMVNYVKKIKLIFNKTL